MPENPNLIILGVPGYQQVEFDWIQHFWQIEWPGPPGILSASAAYLPDAHNIIVESFIGLHEVRHPEQHGYKRAYLCLLEQDMYPHKRFAIRAQTYTEPVVGQLYFRKKYHDQRSIAGFFSDDNGEYETLDDDTIDRWCDEEPGLHRIDVVGMGCTFIRADVLLNWPRDLRPPFKWQPARWGRGASDDMQFHWECKQQGIETYLDTHELAHCGHEGKVRANLKTHREWRTRTAVASERSEEPLMELRTLLGNAE